jgi:hypothetical protein
MIKKEGASSPNNEIRKPANNHENDFPFSAEEIENIREMIKAEERKKWFKTTFSGWVAWISLTLTTIVAGWDSIKKIIKTLAAGL